MTACLDIVLPVVLGVLGAAVGSFLGLLSLRLPAERHFVGGRSRCGTCDRRLGPLDLIPIASFVALRGSCRRCGGKIPWRYPLLEIVSASIGLWAGLSLPASKAIVGAPFAWCLTLLAVLDAEHLWLPRKITFGLMFAGLGVTSWLDPSRWLAHVLGAAVGWGGLVLLAEIYLRIRKRPGLGGGDGPMLGAIGAWVGWQGLPTVLIIAAGTGLLLIPLMRRPVTEAKLPLGALMAIGAWIVWLYGPLTYAGAPGS